MKNKQKNLLAEQKSTSTRKSSAEPRSQQSRRTETETETTAVANPIPILQRAAAAPDRITPTTAKALQRTIGNQAVGRLLIQRKMNDFLQRAFGDEYEPVF